jgi:hypothetical protein
MGSPHTAYIFFMGKHEITPDTLPAFFLRMKTELVVYAVFSCLGVILSFGRGTKASPRTAISA